MARPRREFILPQLKKGTNYWYVEYSFRNPNTDEMNRFRSNLKGTEREMIRQSDKLIKEITTKIKMGWSPFDEENTVYVDKLVYHSESKKYKPKKSGKFTVEAQISLFLGDKQYEINEKSYQTYVSRLRNFVSYLKFRKMENALLSEIDNELIISFLRYIVAQDDLSRLTIRKYQQILHTFFDWTIHHRLLNDNPAKNIPRMGKVVDEAPLAITRKDRTRMSAIIRSSDPQLYLSCVMMFFCAIRPGEELRRLKVKYINFDNDTITIPSELAKNNKQQTIDMPIQLKKIMIEEYYLDRIHREFYVFGKNRVPGREPLGKNTLRNRFNAIRKLYGFPSDYKLYSWKHTGAQALAEANVSPYVIQRHLRHESFETTEHYLRKRIGYKERVLIDQFPDL